MSPPRAASILVVDDVPENVLLVSKLLGREGYEIRTATNGAAALEEVERKRPDLILLDVMMPGIDGIEVCRRIKGEKGQGFLPILLLTAHDESDIRRRGLEAGAEDFVAKPFEQAELIARIRNHLNTKRLYDDLSRSHAYIDREIEAIGALQRSLLPPAPPDLPGVSFHEFYQPSRKAGGDFYDYLPLGGNRVGVAIGDVSGHGPQASVLMAMVKLALYFCSEHGASPEELLKSVNRHLLRFVPPGEFITMLYGVLDLERDEFRMASAGHCPPILFGGARDEPAQMRTHEGLPLCLGRDGNFEEILVPFRRGDRLLLYTDGILEVQDSERRIFGSERFAHLIQEHAESMGNGMIAALWDGAHQFSGGTPFRDDCTLLLLERA